MPVLIKVDQAAAPAGVAGQAREDLVTGVAVTLSAIGGPYSSYLWSIVDKPINSAYTARSAALLSAPAAAVTNISPIDVDGTYKVLLLVDSGSGLGASADDQAEMTFYAGPTLNVDPSKLPRREPAFRERTEHNVIDALDPGGNPRGWAKELGKWFRLLRRLASAHNPSQVTPVKTTGGYTAVDGDVIPVDPTGGAFGVTLPLISSMSPGGTVTVRNVTTSTNAVTMTASGSDTILHGTTGTTYALATSKGYVTFMADPNTSPDRWLTFPAL